MSRRSKKAALLIALALAMAGVGEASGDEPLGLAGSESLKPPGLDSFKDLLGTIPEAGASAAPGVFAGSEGRALAAPAERGGATIALLGDLGPTDDASEKYARMAVDELNLLRPEMVLTVGNLLAGATRDGKKYVEQAQRARRILDGLAMPWYPCAGRTDVVSPVQSLLAASAPAGTPVPQDRRFEELYRRAMGPLCYSVNAGSLHAIVLDSEEDVGTGDTISDAQLKWLKDDLNRTFEGKGATQRARWIIVVVHRPLWRGSPMGGGGGAGSKGNWQRVHELLVEFNRKPIVRVEGFGDAGPGARGPRVMAVFAGGEQAYAQEPVLDGIRYVVLGPTAARPKLGEDADEALRHITLLRFEPGDGGNDAMTTSLVRLGGSGERAILPADTLTLADRSVIDRIAGWDNAVMGVEGMIDSQGAPVGGRKLKLHLNNPLPDPVDIQLRLAGTQFLQSAARREASNASVEGLDLPWELDSPHMIRHLAPGASEAWEFSVERPENFKAGDGAPPQLEIVVHWKDSRGRVHDVVLKRRITVTPRAEATVSQAALAPDKDQTWEPGVAASGSLYAWRIRGDEPRKIAPLWQMAADANHIYIRVRVEDAVHSYWPQMTLVPGSGMLASDAVSVAWAAGTPESGRVQRVWVLPFAPAKNDLRGKAHAAEIWTNAGTDDRQTPLLKLDPKSGISATTQSDAGGYSVTLTLPRKLIVQEPAAAATAPATAPDKIVVGTAIMNIGVMDNDEGPQTWMRSWANEEAGPPGWGRVVLVTPAPATAPAPTGLLPLFHFP